MWQSHKLIVQRPDQPCFGVFCSLAEIAADSRSRAFRLVCGSLPDGRIMQAHGFAFSARCLWLSHDGVYIFLPPCLPSIAGLRWITFSKAPLIRAGMTLEALASIRYVRIQWSHRRSAWLVSFLYSRQPARSRKSVYFPHDRD